MGAWGRELISMDLGLDLKPHPHPCKSSARAGPPGTINGVAQTTLVLQFLPLGHLRVQGALIRVVGAFSPSFLPPPRSVGTELTPCEPAAGRAPPAGRAR